MLCRLLAQGDRVAALQLTDLKHAVGREESFGELVEAAVALLLARLFLLSRLFGSERAFGVSAVFTRSGGTTAGKTTLCSRDSPCLPTDTPLRRHPSKGPPASRPAGRLGP
jgi:hypothetical protein